MNKRIRQSVIDNSNIGTVRHDNYSGAIEKYHKAFADGYYIECISLMESLISDRLESLANQISESKEYSYCTLEKLLQYIDGNKQRPLINDEIHQCLEKLKSWKDDRNRAIHEMAKLSDDLDESFQMRYAKLDGIAKDGLVLFRELDNRIRKLRNKKSHTELPLQN